MKTLLFTLFFAFVSFSIYGQAMSPILGPSKACQGQTIDLYDSVLYGSFVSSDTTVLLLTNWAGQFLGVNTGTVTVTYTIGDTTVTKTVTVNPTPSFMGADSFCTNKTTIYTGSIPGGKWKSSSATIIAIDSNSGIATGISTGTQIITYILPTGCFDIKPVSVFETPSIMTGASGICIGSAYTIAGSPPPGTWTSSNPTIVSIDSLAPYAIGISSGAAIITYSVHGCINTKNVTVSASTCPSILIGGTVSSSATAICINSPVTLILAGASSGCVINYQWQNSANDTLFTNIYGANDSSYIFNASASLFYRCVVSCSISGAIAYSDTVLVSASNSITAHNVIITTDTSCNVPDFQIITCGFSYSSYVTTWFGDGTSENTSLTTTGSYRADAFHSYSLPGAYTVKQVLYTGGLPQDSVEFTYNYTTCQTFPVKFYNDANYNCVFDSGEQLLTLSSLVQVDSNGVAIDTISATSGFYYKANGLPGTVYTFHPISLPPGLHCSCPASGLISDTLVAGIYNFPAKYFAITCSGTSFDLAEDLSTYTGPHAQYGSIIVSNTSCLPDNTITTLQFSPKYVFGTSVPPPTSVIGNIAVWDFSGVSSISSVNPIINYELDVPGAWLIPGDTVISTVTTTGSLTGDIDTSNNVIVKTDTINGSYDPNEITVSPSGSILPCTNLEYTIRFENAGNDTAHNIYVMDTLSASLDPNSINVGIASSVMNIDVIKAGGYAVAKFDFPNINLLDTSHFANANGMVVFSIKTKAGLADGALIQNRAWVYFDDNPGIITNTTQNMIGISAIGGPGNVCIGGLDTLYNASKGGVWSRSNVHAEVSAGIVSGLMAGVDTINYTLTNTCASKMASKVMTVIPLPVAGIITGADHICAGDSAIFTDSIPGGAWSSSDPSIALVSAGGNVLGLSGSAVTISYGYTNFCGTAVAAKVVTIVPDVVPAVNILSSPGDVLCQGSSAIFTPVPVNGGPLPGYTWLVNGAAIAWAPSFSYAPVNGDVVNVQLASSAECPRPATASGYITLTMIPPLTPVVSISAVPGTNISSGEAVTFTAAVTGAVLPVTYQWVVSQTYIAGATSATFTSNSLVDFDSVVCVVGTANVCGEVLAEGVAGMRVVADGVIALSGKREPSIWPNPASDELHIDNAAMSEVRLFNLLGQEVLSSKLVSDKEIVGIQALAPGMYIVQIVSGDGEVQNFRVVVER